MRTTTIRVECDVADEIRRRGLESRTTADAVIRSLLGMAPRRSGLPVAERSAQVEGRGHAVAERSRGRPYEWPFAALEIGQAVTIPWGERYPDGDRRRSRAVQAALRRASKSGHAFRQDPQTVGLVVTRVK